MMKFIIFLILFTVSIAFGATKFLQGDSIKLNDLSKTYTFSTTQGVFPTTASVSGDATMAVSGDLTLKNSGVSAGTYKGGVTVTTKGIVTSATSSFDLTTGITGVLPAANMTLTSLTLTTPTISGDLTLTTGGVKFPATQVNASDSNTLDDYEEKGTWTVTLEGTTTAGAGTYSARVARYTKVGNVVTVVCFADISAHTGTGNIRLTGLPFTTLNVANLFQVMSIGQAANLTLIASNYLQIYMDPNTTTANFVQSAVGGGGASSVAMDVAFSVILTATYLSE